MASGGEGRGGEGERDNEEFMIVTDFDTRTNVYALEN
jgi:hypothetical protein